MLLKQETYSRKDNLNFDGVEELEGEGKTLGSKDISESIGHSESSSRV